MAVTPEWSWTWVETLLHSVFDQPGGQSVGAQYNRGSDVSVNKLPKVATYLEQARAVLLAFTAYPNGSGLRMPRAAQESNPAEESRIAH